MDKEKVIRNEKNMADKRLTGVYIKITERQSKWLKEKNYSPTAILHEGIAELGFE